MIARVLSLAARTYARYAVPLTLLSLLAFLPLFLIVARVPEPVNAAQARELVRTSWELAAYAVVAILMVSGAASPLVRSIASGPRLGQVAATRAGVRGLVCAVLPVLAGILAIVVGLVALVGPGLILLPLLAFAGASSARGIAARLADSAAIARAHRTAAIAVVGIVAMVVVGGAIIAYLRLPLPLPKKPSATALASIHASLRFTAIASAFLAPFLASLLAAVPALDASTDPAEVDR